MRRLTLDNFYFRSSLYTVLALGASVLNYLLYPALTRVLNPQEFGDFATIMAISGQVLAILVSFNLMSIYLVKKYPEEEAREKVQIIQKILIWLFWNGDPCALRELPRRHRPRLSVDACALY